MVLQMTETKGTEEQELLQMIIQMIRPPPFLCKWSFAKRTVLQMANIKWMEEHGLLQMTIWMIRPPPCSSVPLQMVICKEDGPPDDQYFFGPMGLKFAPDLPLVWRIQNFSSNGPTVQELEQSDR